MSAKSVDLRSVSRAALVFGCLGGPIAWVIHLMTSYLLAEWGCVAGLGEITYSEVSVLSWLIILVTVITFAIAAAATGIAYRSDQRLKTDERGGTDTPAPRAHIARTGMITSALFTFVILVETIPLFLFLNRC